MSADRLNQDLDESTLNIRQQALKNSLACLDELQRGSRPGDWRYREMLVAYLKVLAAINAISCFQNAEEITVLLEGVYAYKPWHFGWEVRQALCELALNTTYHPCSLDIFFQLLNAVEGSSEVEWEKEVMLNNHITMSALRYVIAIRKAWIDLAPYQEIVEKWSQNQKQEIQALLLRLRANLKMTPLLPE